MYTRCIHADCAMCQIKTIKLEKRRFHKILLSSCNLFFFVLRNMSNTDLFTLSCHFDGIISELSVLFRPRRPSRTTTSAFLCLCAQGETEANTSVSADRITELPTKNQEE